MTIGEALKQSRKRFGYTLKDLAQKTHFSVSYLSNVERGATSPTLAAIEILCNALRLDLIELLKAERSPSPLLKKADRTQLYADRDGVLENIVADNDVFRCTSYTMDPHFRDSIRLPDGDKGDVVGYLLSGQLELDLNGTVYHMDPGDTIFIPSGLPYSFRQLGEEKNVTLWFYLRRFATM